MSRWEVRHATVPGQWRWGRKGSDAQGLTGSWVEAIKAADQAARAIHGKICQSCPKTPADYDCPYVDGYNPGSNSGD